VADEVRETEPSPLPLVSWEAEEEHGSALEDDKDDVFVVSALFNSQV